MMLARSTMGEPNTSSSNSNSGMNNMNRHHHFGRGRGVASPRTGATSAPVNHDSAFYRPPRTLLSSPLVQRHSLSSRAMAVASLSHDSSSPLSTASLTCAPGSSLNMKRAPMPPLLMHDQLSSSSSQQQAHLHLQPPTMMRRLRASSLHEEDDRKMRSTGLLKMHQHHPHKQGEEEEDRKLVVSSSVRKKRVMSVATASLYMNKARNALQENDQMVYLEGPQVYSCAHCRTHLTCHDEIVSKSFHGRRGRAFLFDHCVNVKIGKAEDRSLITGMHSVCDIFCKRCKTLVGWTYLKAYEASQKYKENKFIIEKINLYLEESPQYGSLTLPAGEKPDRWRRRARTWGDDAPKQHGGMTKDNVIYEYCDSTPEDDDESHHDHDVVVE